MSDLRIVVVGAAGRMGRNLIQAINGMPGLALTGALERAGSAVLGQDSGNLAGCGINNIPISDDPLTALAEADVLIDFTTPTTTVQLSEFSAQARIVHVIGTTGLSSEDLKKIETAARHAVIIRSGNMSLGVNLLAALVRRVSATLDSGFDIEILEMHHRMKVDSPSGTAILLGEAAAEGRKIPLDKEHSIVVRDGYTGAREQGSIGFAALRGGTVIGDHSVIFAGPSERITLSHIAEDRSIFAQGAIRAAIWGKGRKPGLYSMMDVLGINDI